MLKNCEFGEQLTDHGKRDGDGVDERKLERLQCHRCRPEEGVQRVFYDPKFRLRYRCLGQYLSFNHTFAQGQGEDKNV